MIRASDSYVAMFIYDKPWSYSDALECGEVGIEFSIFNLTDKQDSAIQTDPDVTVKF